MTSYVRHLSECGSNPADLVGGKALGLGRLLDHGHRVPPGFVITTAAYRACVTTISAQIDAILQHAADADVAAATIAPLFTRDVMGADVSDAIVEAYLALGPDAAVAVRSSATAEDSDAASFAGQQDTYLWVTGAQSVVDHVVRCWQSLYTERAIGYRRARSAEALNEAMAVVVQQMVPADAAGVMMTLHPQSGDRDVVYIESSLGLGESVVRGEVSPDSFEVAKADLRVVNQRISTKATLYRRGGSSGAIEQIAVDTDRASAASLSPNEVEELARLGVAIERDFGQPMDIEWSMTHDDTGMSEFLLLQARPETVWTNRSRISDPINTDKGVAGTYWTTANVGEAMPGVQTPLSWTVWQHKLDHGMREAGYAMGILDAAERVDVLAPIVDVFFGRTAVKVNFFTLFGDRAPGTSGAELAKTYFGSVPPDLTLAPTRRRYPMIALRTPVSFARIAGKVRKFAAEQDIWWTARLAEVPLLDLAGARRLLAAAEARHDEAVVMQCVSTLVAIQPVYDELVKLAARSGADLSALSAVPGGPEMDVIADIWRASRGVLSVSEVLARHGFHGPNEGELSARVWREDPAPLSAMIAQYAARSDADDPVADHRARRAARTAMERDLIASLPRILRPQARAVLALARRRIPLRGLAKRSMLQSFDVARAAARQIGDHLVREGILAESDDVFFFTVEELADPAFCPDRALANERRSVHYRYRQLALPGSWSATPTPVAVNDHSTPGDGDCIDGVGVSAGSVTGPARVLLAPDFGAVEQGEILVAPHTDPSWCSVMFLSAALVVDIGGALSHTALVARELSLPCVVNTGDGTRRIHTGDLIRVDGVSGKVEILDRATSPERSSL
jgi:pyruvate,water dikinase